MQDVKSKNVFIGKFKRLFVSRVTLTLKPMQTMDAMSNYNVNMYMVLPNYNNK